MSLRFVLSAVLIFLCYHVHSQTVADHTVQVSAVVNSSPPSITLNWPADSSANTVQVSRKMKGSGSWGFVIGSLPGSASTWTDTTVNVGDNYEYKVYKSTSAYQGEGYIYAGIEKAVKENRGKVILLVDSSISFGISAELQQFEYDLIGDGWEIVKHLVSPNDPVTAVKSLVTADYNAAPASVKAVILLGHVPVPYSGNLFPDGHTNHRGAWPADLYYGDVNGVWTDNTVSETSASRTENHNIPGDGKFDQSTHTGVELFVGRIDFDNMPAFTESETDLLRRYLQKNHAFRHHEFAPPPSGVIDDNFGVFGGEIFAANGWRNFAPLVHPANVAAGDFRTTLNSTPHLWAYGCGGGTYSSANGVGTTANFASDSLLGVFSMIFGSYHGDYDSQNNFLRAALASKGNLLTCAWAGRPHWQFHQMGLGEPIGFSTMTSQNNFNLYFSSFFPRSVSMALMGDPTLRMQMVAPVSNFTATSGGNGQPVNLNWTASTDTVLGYHIYRADTIYGAFTRLNSQLITGISWNDPCPLPGNSVYMIRAYRLETGPSGTYYNLSQGIFTNMTMPTGGIQVQPLANPGPYCAGDPIGLVYQANGPRCPGNTFYLEMSDGTGDFTNPDTLASTTDTASVNQLVGIIPAITPAGSNYRLRVVSDLPAYVGNDNGNAIVVNPLPQAGFTYNLSGITLTLTNTSTLATSYAWNFGDGNVDTVANPVHVYANQGTYNVILIATNACGNDTLVQIVGQVGEDPLPIVDLGITVYPNPSSGLLRLEAGAKPGQNGVFTVYDLAGKQLLQKEIISTAEGFQEDLDLGSFGKGVYILGLVTKSGRRITRIVLE